MTGGNNIFVRAVHVRSLFKISSPIMVFHNPFSLMRGTSHCSHSARALVFVSSTKKDDEASRQRLHTLRPTVRDLPSTLQPRAPLVLKTNTIHSKQQRLLLSRIQLTVNEDFHAINTSKIFYSISKRTTNC